MIGLNASFSPDTSCIAEKELSEVSNSINFPAEFVFPAFVP